MLCLSLNFRTEQGTNTVTFGAHELESADSHACIDWNTPSYWLPKVPQEAFEVPHSPISSQSSQPGYKHVSSNFSSMGSSALEGKDNFQPGLGLAPSPTVKTWEGLGGLHYPNF